MGLLQRIFGSGEGLPELPEEAGILDVTTLSVRTAAEWVIVTVDTGGMRALIDASLQRTPLQLRGPGRAVTFVPTRHAEKIVLDPDHGWVVPLTREAAAEVSGLSPAEAENPLAAEFVGGTRLAIVVDAEA